RIKAEVEERRLVDELDPGQRRRAALLAERGKLGLEWLVQLPVARSELVPARRVGRGVARERRRQGRVLQLERVARDDPYPRAAGRGDGRERNHVVLDD